MDYNTNPDTGHVYLTSELGNIVSTEVIDEYTVKINLSTVDAALPSVFTNICGLMLAPSTLGAEDMAIHPVGTGAFKLEEYVEGDHIFLTAYENYWDKGADGQALPYLDRVESTSWAMTPCARSTCRPATSTWWTITCPATAS